MKTTISFPGLGIEEFTMNRVAFSLFGLEIYWYAIFIVLGMVAAFFHASIRARRERIKSDDLLDIGLWTLIIGVIGARLYYVLTTLKDGGYESILDIISTRDGGLAIYGGVIGGALAIVTVSRIKKLNPLRSLDAIAPGVMLAQSMGRWGNFVNGEAFGYEAAEGSLLYPLRMTVNSSFTHYETVVGQPTFLYESLWNIVGFVLITCFYRKKSFNGQILLCYLTWYGFGRMFIEGLRTDSLWVGPFRISQVVGAACFVLGAAAMIAGLILTKKGRFERWLAVDYFAPVPAEGPAETAETAEDTADTEAPTEPTAEPDLTQEEPETDTQKE